MLAASRPLLGEEHPDTLRAMGNLAATLTARGDHAGAQQLREQVREISTREDKATNSGIADS